MKAARQAAVKRFPLGASLIFGLFYSAAFGLAVAPQMIVRLLSGQ